MLDISHKSTSSVRVFKNTFFLYFRMFLVMGVSLFTSRVVLQILGEKDYGIYGVVGGTVAAFAFFNLAMTSATQRFLAFDIGASDNEQLSKTFKSTLIIHTFIAILVLILAETVGLWFVENKLYIPDERRFVISWVYQASVFITIIGILQVPYNALIIAKEKINIYAIISIIEAVLKLAIVYALSYSIYDKLKLYSVLLLSVSLLLFVFHIFYCNLKYRESKMGWFFEKQFYKKILSYFFWNIFGNAAIVFRTQGFNFILNFFYGTVLNATYSIALQVQGVVNIFVVNFLTAINPQIIKSYASKDLQKTNSLILLSSRLSFFLIIIMIVPIIRNLDYLLLLWLGTTLPYLSDFIILILFIITIESISSPLITGIQASGRVRLYQLVVSIFIFLNLPVSYYLITITDNPNYIFYTNIFFSTMVLFVRLIFVKRILNITLYSYYNLVIKNILIILLAVICMLVYVPIFDYTKNFIYFILEILVTFIILAFLIYFFGVKVTEKAFIKTHISLFFNKFKNKSL